MGFKNLLYLSLKDIMFLGKSTKKSTVLFIIAV